MASKMMRIAGRTEEGKASAIQITRNGGMKQSLADTEVLRKEYNHLILNASLNVGSAVGVAADISNYSVITIVIRNMYNQDIRLRSVSFREKDGSPLGANLWDRIVFQEGYMEIKAGSNFENTLILSHEDYPQLKMGYPTFNLTLDRGLNVPSSGFVEILVLGR